MGVVEKLQSMFGERFTSAVKDANGFTAGFFVEWILVRYPGTADVLQTKRLRVARDIFDMIATLFIPEMAADRLQSPGVEFRSESLWS